MLDDFVIRSLLGGLALAVAASPLGCFVVWRKMVYYGDATAHSAVLGISLSLYFSISIFMGVFLMALLASLVVTLFVNRYYSADTILGVFSHATLAFGIIAVNMLPSQNVNIESYLFGQLLAVTKVDLIYIWSGAITILFLILFRWKNLLISTVSEELTIASGMNPKWEYWILNLGLAILIAVAIKVVGILLVTAMLIIPPAAARPLVRQPLAMVFISGIIGCLSVIIGLLVSLYIDTPTGPSIIAIATIIFIMNWVMVFLYRGQKSSMISSLNKP
ncbi:MAG: metal ABC transporter permease [Rhodobacteraceae bacterium]|nr:metal ABC transporter permease [Paracoccaceae bacterium]MDE2738274.1 metal ABC transporter permease [Paracoccaceae bacterium]MYE36074.1 metal ABC transporter permease [Paracoccaceae bacterium]